MPRNCISLVLTARHVWIVGKFILQLMIQKYLVTTGSNKNRNDWFQCDFWWCANKLLIVVWHSSVSKLNKQAICIWAWQPVYWPSADMWDFTLEPRYNQVSWFKEKRNCVLLHNLSLEFPYSHSCWAKFRQCVFVAFLLPLCYNICCKVFIIICGFWAYLIFGLGYVFYVCFH